MINFTDRKKVVVILNGISLKKKFFYHEVEPKLKEICDVQVFETLSKNDAVTIASREKKKNPDLILAAGGDGTLNQVVNGVLSGSETDINLPTIGLIPIGSGNDFARTSRISGQVTQLIELIKTFTPKPIDIGKIYFTTLQSNKEMSERYFVNMADLGMGPMVVDKVQKSGREFGHAFAYYKGIISTFFSYQLMTVKAVTTDWVWEGKLRTLGIGNGKYYGHGLCITPDAVLDDRKFEAFICGNVSVFDFIKYTGKLKAGKHIRIPEIHYKSTTSIEFTSDKSCMIEGDGEILGLLPAKVELIERQLNFLI
jgi:diacylglycerol kinase (ATP)